MTNRVTRYTQPVVQTTPGLDFKVEEVELFEDPKGKWVRYDDIKHLLPDEPPSKSDAEFLSLVGHCSNCSCQDCREFFKADARAQLEPTAEHYAEKAQGIAMDADNAALDAEEDLYDAVARYRMDHPENLNSQAEPPADRKSALDEIVRISEEAGLYDTIDFADACDEASEPTGVDWIRVSDRAPDHSEPVVYARPHRYYPSRWSIGIAYWTVSQRWNPEQESTEAPQGFTHWKPLGRRPQVKTSGPQS